MAVRALCVGVSQSGDLAPLPRALNDAGEIHDYLVREAFGAADVSGRLLCDPRRSEFAAGLDWLARTNRDLAVLFYSGHAVRATSGRAVLVCSDSGDDPSSQLTALDIGRTLSRAKGCSLLLILDCCYAEDVARDIRAELGWDIEGSTFLLSSESTMLTIQPETHVSYSDNAPTERLSIFTRSLCLGLRGVAQERDAVQVDLLRLMQLANYEAIRLGGARPTLAIQGVDRKRGMRGASATRTSWDDVAFHVRTRERAPTMQSPERPGITRLIGSQGLHSEMFAKRLLGGRNVTKLSGAGRVPLALTSRPSAMLTTAVVDSILNADVLKDAEALQIPVIATSDKGGDALASDPPAPEVVLPEVGVEMLSEFRPAGDVSDRTWEALGVVREFASDSLEAALVAMEAIELPGDQGLSAGELEDAVGAYLTERLKDRNWLEIARLLCAAPSVYLPETVLCDFISDGQAEGRRWVTNTLAEMRRTGVIIPRRVGVRMTDRIRRMLGRVGVEPAGEQYNGMLARGLSSAEGVDRIEVLSALCASVETALVAGRLEGELVDLLATVGRDLAYWSGPRPARYLLEAVLSVDDYINRSALWRQLGDAQRLDDDYPASSAAFEKALATAQDTLERADAEAGIASANKNLESGVDGLQRAMQKTGSVSPTEVYAAKAMANLLFQRANLLYASSDWTASTALYEQAEALLDPELRGDTSLLLDVWKGLGDVALHQGRVETASVYLTKCLDLAASRSIPLADTRAHAKMCQFAGDVARHQACTHEDDVQIRRIDCAKWWNLRAEELYAVQNLELGVLISRFRLAQCAVLSEEYEESAGEFISLRERFTGLQNALWQYKCDVMLVASSVLGDMGHTLWAVGARADVESSIGIGGMSPYQEAWGRLVLGDTDAVGLANQYGSIGASRVAELVLGYGLSRWIGGEY